MVYQSKDLKEVHQVPLDQSPTILIPYYDQDSNTLFVSGKVQHLPLCSVIWLNLARSNTIVIVIVFNIKCRVKVL